jgi:hypothetical protein
MRNVALTVVISVLVGVGSLGFEKSTAAAATQ